MFAQGRRITGRVLDERGQGLPSAGITVKGTQVGTVTDLDGNFQLNVPEGSTTLTVQGVGYTTQDVPITNGLVTVRMATASRELTGAVVTALAIRREKRDIGYSATTINSDELNAGNNVSVLSAIQGKTAGANISSNTGGPGGSTRVVLRGEKSISGNNNALIVVDGIPINNTNRLAGQSNLEQVDFGNRGNDINPEDVESISVLKGPAAAALYGSQAANGAIMITTKSGKSRKGPGKTEITYTTSYTLSDILKYPSFQNKFGQGDMSHTPNDRRENFSWGLPFDNQPRPWGQIINGMQQVKPYSALPNNVRNFFQKGQTWENNVSLGGSSANDRSTYYLSLNHLKNEGVVPNNYYYKYGVRFNGSTQLTNKLYSSININYLNINTRTDAQGQAQGSIWDNIIQTPRDIPITELSNLESVFNAYEIPTATGATKYGYYGAYTDNPYYLASFYDNRNRTDRVLGSVTIGYRPNDRWDVFNRLGGDIVADRTFLKTPKYNSTPFDPFYAGNTRNVAGGYREVNTNSSTVYNDLIAQHTRAIGRDVDLNVLVGNNVQYSRTNSLSGDINYKTNGLVLPNFYSLTNGTGPVQALNTLEEYFQVGVYGSVRLDYRRTLFLELTARNDWSSTLLPPTGIMSTTNSASSSSGVVVPSADNTQRTDVRLGRAAFFYPSASVSYVFTENIKNQAFKDILNYGKLRASFASVGNAATPYQNNGPGFVRASVTGNFTTQVLFPFNNIPGNAYQRRLASLDLRPERTNSSEVGAELSFLRDRISLDFSYYTSSSIDQILDLPIPTSTGFATITQNVGDVFNRGVELAVRTTPVRTRTGFRWDIFGTYTRNRSEVVRLQGGVTQVSVGGFSGLDVTATVGKPYGAFYGIDYLRDPQGRTVVDSATGLPRSNANPTFLGSFQPRFIASWGTNLSYKGFTLGLLFDTKQGGKFYSNTKRGLDFVGVSEESAYNDRNPYVLANSVYENSQGQYVNNTTPLDPYLLYTSIYQNVTAVHIVDASYVKLREASLTYTVPDRLIKNTFIGRASIGIFGNNLAIWTAAENKYVDPEVNAAGASNLQGFDFTARPSLRNYGARLSVSF